MLESESRVAYLLKRAKNTVIRVEKVEINIYELEEDEKGADLVILQARLTDI